MYPLDIPYLAGQAPALCCAGAVTPVTPDPNPSHHSLLKIAQQFAKQWSGHTVTVGWAHHNSSNGSQLVGHNIKKYKVWQKYVQDGIIKDIDKLWFLSSTIHGGTLKYSRMD